MKSCQRSSHEQKLSTDTINSHTSMPEDFRQNQKQSAGPQANVEENIGQCENIQDDTETKKPVPVEVLLTQMSLKQFPQFDQDECQRFIHLQNQAGKRIVLITSGGTTVPLEKSNVRFIDNFSAGTRGATSAEYFLEQGYGVIFMHRQFSLQPFARCLAQSSTSLLDYLHTNADGVVEVNRMYQDEIAKTMRRFEKVKSERTLFKVHFTTIDEYLFLLHRFAVLLKPYSSSVLFYLAAAVSDFIVPPQKLPEHKIQSSNSTLELTLAKAPKVLQALIENQWAPQAFICSFKLETDPDLLIPKAKAALKNYGHQCVVANILARRAYEVVLVTEADEEWLTLSAHEAGKVEIEKELVVRIVEKHSAWIASAEKQSTKRDDTDVDTGSA